MRKLVIAALASGFLLLCMANSYAQGPLPGIASFDYLQQPTVARDAGLSPGWFGSFAQVEPALHAPRLFVAWSPNISSIKLAATANAYGDAFNNGYGEGTIEWSTNGVWLGLSLPAQVTKRLSADLQGWYFIPGNQHVEAFGRASGLREGDTFADHISGNLDIKTTWFAIDLEGCLHVSKPYGFLAGVRYDYLQGTITLPGPLEAMVVGQFPGVRPKLDIGLNSIFPYVGVKTSLSTGLGSMTFSVKGFPWAISVADAHPKSGYFGELFFSYQVSPVREFSLSFFAKADVAHAAFDEYSQVANVFKKDPSIPQTVGLEETLPVTWRQYMIGGVATVNFGLPFL